jgi:uncharacterized protein YbaA (DUF1428 family)
MTADIRIREHRADRIIDLLDEYLEACEEHRKAVAACVENNGVVIYDIVYREKDARDDARERLRDAFKDLQL